MKYKILLIGKNRTVIDDFFTHLNDTFECQSTSSRYADIVCHIKYFEPDAFIYCMSEESKDNITDISFIKKEYYKRIPFVIIGNQQDINKYNRVSTYGADFVLVRPISIKSMEDKIIEFLEDTAKNKDREIPVQEKKPEPVKLLDEDELMALEQEILLEEERLKPKKHILVVDDDAVMLKVIRRYLSDQYEVATALSGKVALKFLENKKTDMILLDYEMPEENGAAVLEKIRKRESTKDLPVVFLTGVSDSDRIQQVLSFKPQGYLLKPIDREKLLEKIKEIIG